MVSAQKGQTRVITGNAVGAYGALLRQAAAKTVTLFPRTEMLDLVVVDGVARGIITRNLITGKIEAMLPEGIAFVPAHPMAGSEKRGNASARADLFEGARCILTPTDRTPPEAVEAVRQMWEGVGCAVATLDAAVHDRIVAQVSHLPHLVAPAVLNAADESSLPFAATGMKDTTRIAASDVDLWIDIFKDNRENILAALARFVDETEALRTALDDEDWGAIAGMLERARDRRGRIEEP